MIKNRSFMIGLGSGLLAGALLLQLMNVGAEHQVSSLAPEVGKLTKEQLQEQAEAMDLMIVDADDKRMTEVEWKQQMINKSSKPQGSGPSAPTAGNAAKAPKTPEQPAAPDSKTSNQAPKTDAPSASKAPQTPETPSVTVKITSGSNLTDVAATLKKSGVISDADSFVQKGRSRKMSTKVRSGSYVFKPGEDFDSIIAKITTKTSS
ncbi:peptidase [Paenibacillus sp.]|uniref:peptidase n=1 Tax=Paenibacillus sp. TaxID=58172 RepID=UPI002839DDA3|nr:peptidase [Paenibacillus sp.]MDR0270052.1 peptidase [Paenibacillus sp.]